MNEIRETANADVYQAISRSVKDIASGRSDETSGLTIHRVSPVIDRSYAVGFKSGICLGKWPDSLPAGWKKPDLFHENLALRAKFS
jgi:hypothetical protein